ncbi:ABC transporter permease [Chitinophaga caseinilytica]|uniref:ABC transporter permease n=1 Tax=Chitinophaga caseinilytica TaxID=2267521 RepID=UPI003C2FE256
MWMNYIKIAWRNLSRNRMFSIINILGLAIGIAASLLILQYVSNELSYDGFHEKKDRIYRVQQQRMDEGNNLSTNWAAGTFGVGTHLKNEFTEVEEVVKLIKAQPLLMNVAGKSGEGLRIEQAFWATPSFLKVFSVPLLKGDAATVLSEPNTLLLSETVAKKLFGEEDPVGKNVLRNQGKVFRVVGVYADLPENSHIHPQTLTSWSTFVKDAESPGLETTWTWDGCLTYVLLHPGSDPAAMEARFPGMVKRLAKMKDGTPVHVAYSLMPLSDIHLYSHGRMEAEPNGDGNTVYLLLGIALFIIVIAWINYINLATARALNRAVEVGVRKAVGSQRSQLVWQFLLESALLNALAVGLAVLLMSAVMPLFNNISGQSLTMSLFGSRVFWTALTGLYLAGSLLSGMYPAFVLSRFKPVAVLKGKVISSRQGAALRKALVVFQFAASLFLLVGTLIVFKQIRFMRSQELGFQMEQTLVVKAPMAVDDAIYGQKLAALRNSLRNESLIRELTASSYIPGQPVDFNAAGIRLRGEDFKMGKEYRVVTTDGFFVQAFGLKLLAGRGFSDQFGGEGESVMFNRTGLRKLGFAKPEDAIGKQINFWEKFYTIVGVVDDFHQESLRESIEPLIFRYEPGVKGAISMRITADNAQQAITKVQQQYAALFPDNPFDYFFLDQYFDNQYKADQRFGQVFGVFTGLAIFVACLGLFGLASFTVMQRTKEIGVRKVLGASVPQILGLLYREYATLILWAFGMGAPLAWWFSARWLDGYAFRTGMGWMPFVLPLLIVLVVAFLTVGIQSFRAATANPVKSLRSE